jgi:hypothetical protein
LSVVPGEYCGDCGMALERGARCPRCGSRHPRPLPPRARWCCYNCSADVGVRSRKCSQCGGRQFLPHGFEPTMRGMTALLREEKTLGGPRRMPAPSVVSQAERMQTATPAVRQAERPQTRDRQSPVRTQKNSNAIWWVLIVLAGMWILGTITKSLTNSTPLPAGPANQATIQKNHDYMESLTRTMRADDGPYGP